MPNPEIEEFAKMLVQEVRDAAIKSCDRALQPNVAYPLAKRWRAAADKGDLELIASVVIPDTVDETLFHLLQAIDQGFLQLSFTAPNGKKSICLRMGSANCLGGTWGVVVGAPLIQENDLSTIFQTLSDVSGAVISGKPRPRIL
jgi:hypothetical protein